jgi:hypothetical protein
MITTKHVPPFAASTLTSTKIPEIYNMIVDNIKRSCLLDKRYLILDNTYQSLDSVCETVNQTKQNTDIYIILNLIDPPFPWHYLKQILSERFPDVKFYFLGSDAPDADIQYWFIYSRNIFPKYSDSDLMSDKFDHVFLNYNMKPHYHRTELIDRMREQDLLKFGHWTTQPTKYKYVQTYVPDLGSLSIWRSSFLNIVSETVFRLNTEPLLVTEKIFKPLLGLRPWIINGSPKYYHQYKGYGFDCFEDMFPVTELAQDASTVEATVAKNHKLICDVVQDLSKENLESLYKKLLPRLIYNREHALKLAAEYEDRCCNRPLIF